MYFHQLNMRNFSLYQYILTSCKTLANQRGRNNDFNSLAEKRQIVHEKSASFDALFHKILTILYALFTSYVYQSSGEREISPLLSSCEPAYAGSVKFAHECLLPLDMRHVQGYGK